MDDVNDLVTDLKGQVLSEARVSASKATVQFVCKQEHSVDPSLSFTVTWVSNMTTIFEVLAVMFLTFQVF
jgi:hypothetical protein